MTEKTSATGAPAISTTGTTTRATAGTSTRATTGTSARATSASRAAAVRREAKENPQEDAIRYNGDNGEFKRTASATTVAVAASLPEDAVAAQPAAPRHQLQRCDHRTQEVWTEGATGPHQQVLHGAHRLRQEQHPVQRVPEGRTEASSSADAPEVQCENYGGAVREPGDVMREGGGCNQLQSHGQRMREGCSGHSTVASISTVSYIGGTAVSTFNSCDIPATRSEGEDLRLDNCASAPPGREVDQSEDYCASPPPSSCDEKSLQKKANLLTRAPGRHQLQLPRLRL